MEAQQSRAPERPLSLASTSDFRPVGEYQGTCATLSRCRVPDPMIPNALLQLTKKAKHHNTHFQVPIKRALSVPKEWAAAMIDTCPICVHM